MVFLRLLFVLFHLHFFSPPVDEVRRSGVIQDVVSMIQGGTTATLTKLNELLSSNARLIDVENYVDWAATLPQAPVVIRQEVRGFSSIYQ